MNQSNSTQHPGATAPGPVHEVEPARRQGERVDERRSGERRDGHDDECDPDFARGEDRRSELPPSPQGHPAA